MTVGLIGTHVTIAYQDGTTSTVITGAEPAQIRRYLRERLVDAESPPPFLPLDAVDKDISTFLRTEHISEIVVMPFLLADLSTGAEEPHGNDDGTPGSVVGVTALSGVQPDGTQAQAE